MPSLAEDFRGSFKSERDSGSKEAQREIGEIVEDR